MEILGKFWVDFGDFQVVSESFGEFLRLLEIFGDFWIVIGECPGISRSFGVFLRFFEIFGRGFGDLQGVQRVS